MKRFLFAATLCCAGLAQANMVSGFNGTYDVSNWTSLADTGSISTLGAPDAVALTSGDDGSSSTAFSSFFIQFGVDATVQFSWDYASNDTDPLFDTFGYVLSNDLAGLLAGFGQLSDDAGGLSQSGAQSVVVSAGQYFGFAMLSDNFGGAATTTVNGLRIDEVPEPGSLALLAVALAAAAATTRRSRAA
jgi:hypothetical protein